jgi:hypothetical protein
MTYAPIREAVLGISKREFVGSQGTGERRKARVRLIGDRDMRMTARYSYSLQQLERRVLR